VPNPREPFLDLCLLYSDFNRPVFLEAFLNSFVDSASPAEMKTLRRALRDRARALRRSRKKGRPRAEKSWAWIRSTMKLVWHREIDGWSWPRIATALGIKPTKPNIRTLRNRTNHLATLVWQALPAPANNLKALNKWLNNRSIQRFLRSRFALPFNTHPQESKKLVLKLLRREELSSRQA